MYSILGESVTKQPLIKSMRGVKKETLNLISCWVSKSNDHKLVSSLVQIYSNFFGHIILVLYLLCYTATEF